MQTAREVRFFLHFGLGLPCLMVGFFLLSPIFVWATERVFGPLVAAMFGLRYAMLRQQRCVRHWARSPLRRCRPPGTISGSRTRWPSP